MASVQSPAATAIRRRVKRKGRALPAVITIVIASVLGWWGWNKLHPAEDAAGKMLTDTVTRGEIVETVSATGSVTSQTGAQVKIGSQITGRIKRLYADVGSKVRAGQVIAELDLPDIQAQVAQAEASLAAARTKLAQQLSGVAMQRTQTGSAVTQTQAELHSVEAQLASAMASARLQAAQTPADVRRAETGLGVAKAALSTAKSNLAQVQASANLQISTAQEQLAQANANASNSALNLKRQQELLQKGFVAPSVVDAAQAQASVNQSQVNAAQQNVQLIREKVAADLQSAKDQVTQAQQNVEAAQAALDAARAETYQDAAKQANVNDARAKVRQAQATLKIAQGNTAQDLLKQQDVQQAKEAVNVAEAQVAYAKAQLDKTFIRSPISGTVLQLASQQGETLAAGLSAPTLIIVADLKRLQVDVFVDETDIGKINIGQEVDITVDAFPKRVIKGVITKVASGSTIQQGVITYDVTIALRKTRLTLKPDMTASVTIRTGTHSNVLRVPSEAVKVGVGGSTVNVLVKKDGKSEVEKRKVKTGVSDGVNTEIREGLKEGETIVLAGADDGRPRGGKGGNSPFGPSGKKKK